MFAQLGEFFSWYDAQLESQQFHVEPVSIEELDGWGRDSDTGNLVHRSGRFFSIRGIRVETDHGPVDQWEQPIIDQPEVGILGIITHRFNGQPHFLMQAKVEPGNINSVQLSPTVQATRSNYGRVHGGRAIPYLKYFIERGHGRMLSDVLQSEQGAWFLHKRNRNMIIEVPKPIDVLPGFCWLTREQIGALLHVDNLVNMDSRTVLAGYPIAEFTGDADKSAELFSAITGPGAQRTPTRRELATVLSWFTEARARYHLARTAIPLSAVGEWDCGGDRISHRSGHFFEVIGVNVHAGSREVSAWSQPLLAPRHNGVIAFLTRWINGRPHVLAHAHTQAGTHDVVELGPTVQCAPGNYGGVLIDDLPKYLDEVLAAPASMVRFDAVHSEEGGRFYHAENRYRIVEVEADFADEPGPDYLWITVTQLAELARFGNHVNVEARNLLACLLFSDHPAADLTAPSPAGTSTPA